MQKQHLYICTLWCIFVLMRLSIEISSEQHQQIKAMAALQGKSIKDLVLEKLFGNSEDEDQVWKELMVFLRERIAHVERGGVSDKTPDQIANEVLKRNNSL